jgi:hypothetical protein
MQNIPIHTKKKLHSFRKLAIGSWTGPHSKEIYTQLTLPIDKVLSYIEEYNAIHHSKVTLIHFFAKALSICFHAYPQLNTALIRRQLYHRKEVSFFFQTAFKELDEYDLSGFNLPIALDTSLKEISALHTQKKKALCKKKDPQINKVRRLFKYCPSWISPSLISILNTILYTFNISPKRLGLPQDRMGSAMISDLSSIALDTAYVPLFPFSRCAFSISLGTPHPAPIIRNGTLQVAPVTTISFTIDHRYLDGIHLAKASEMLKTLFDTPEKILNKNHNF